MGGDCLKNAYKILDVMNYYTSTLFRGVEINFYVSTLDAVTGS